MKFKSVESIIKNNRSIQIRRTEQDVQWIGDGSAFYPLYGFPELDEDSIFRFFDIPEDKQSKYTYSENVFSDNFDVSDNAPSDKLVKRSEIRIIDGGMKLLPLYTSEGVIFINEKYLAPFSDEENGFELYERKGRGQTLIAVKTGFLLSGLVAPVQFKNDKELCTIASQLAAQTAEKDDKQIYIDE